MGNMNAVKTGLESPTPHFTPVEAPLASALNAAPLTRTFQVAGLNCRLWAGAFGVAFNPHTIYTAEWYYASIRTFRGKTYVEEVGTDPFEWSVEYDQDETTLFPSASFAGDAFFQPSSPLQFNQSSGVSVNPAALDPDDPAWLSRTETNLSYAGVEGEFFGKEETRFNEVTPTEVSTKIQAGLEFLEDQDLDAVWANTDTYPYSGYEYAFPSYHLASVSPELGHSTLATSNFAPAAVTTYLASRNDPAYDGVIRPQVNGYAGNTGMSVSTHNAAVPQFDAQSAFHGFYPSAGFVTQRKQIKANAMPIRYTICEIIQGYREGHWRWAFRVLSEGTLATGDIIELPPPSVTEFPFISETTGIAAAFIAVTFIPEFDPMTCFGGPAISEYVTGW